MTFQTTTEQAEAFFSFVAGYSVACGEELHGMCNGPAFAVLAPATKTVSPWIDRDWVQDAESLCRITRYAITDRAQWRPDRGTPLEDGLFAPADPLDLRYGEMRVPVEAYWSGQRGDGAHYWHAQRGLDADDLPDGAPITLSPSDYPPNSKLAVLVPRHTRPTTPSVCLSPPPEAETP